MLLSKTKVIKLADLKDDDYLFCHLYRTNTGYCLRKVNHKVPYTNLGITRTCLHSLISAGAITAANNGVLKTEYLKGTDVSSMNQRRIET